MADIAKRSVYLYVAIVMAAASIAYWSVFSLNAYNTFHEYTALDYYAYNMYYDSNYPGVMRGLQLLVFGVHIAPDQLGVLALYYFFQSPVTLLLVQDAVLSLTGLVIFFVARDLLRSGVLGLLMCFLFLVSPAMHGLLVFDYHAEMLIIPFYILTFYYYMKLNRGRFLLSLALLLGAMDEAAILVIAMWLGLVAFELTHGHGGRAKAERLRMGTWMLAGGVGALAAYNLVYYFLASGYGTYYAGVPQFFRVVPWPGVPVYGGLAQSGGEGASGWVALFRYALGGAVPQNLASSFNFYVVYGLVAGALAFGFSSMLEVLPLAAFLGPWLAAIFVFGASWLASVDRQYFAYVLGGVFAAAVLGIGDAMERKSIVWRVIPSKTGRVHEPMARALIISSALSITAIVVTISLYLHTPGNSTSLSGTVLLQLNATQSRSYADLNRVISMVPKNASLMTQDSVMPHVMDRQYLELFWGQPYFRPEYILVDPTNALLTPYLLGDQYGPAFSYVTENNYTLVAQSGTAMLYRAP